jgi:hypothetical protein
MQLQAKDMTMLYEDQVHRGENITKKKYYGWLVELCPKREYPC